MPRIRVSLYKTRHKCSRSANRHRISKRTSAINNKIYDSTYIQENWDIEKAVVTLEKGNKEDLQFKYKKYYELIHA